MEIRHPVVIPLNSKDILPLTSLAPLVQYPLALASRAHATPLRGDNGVKKSLRAVFFPNEFEPFPGWTREDLTTRWTANPPWVLAHMAHAAYHAKSKVTAVLGRLGATEVRFYDRDGAQAFLAAWPDKAILAFRGSEPRETSASAAVPGLRLSPELVAWLSNDVLADLAFRTTVFDGRQGVEVHTGFLREIDKLWQDHIASDLDGIAAPAAGSAGVPIWVTGHSLGAGMATLAAMRRPFHGVVTFGEPRVGRGLDGILGADIHTRYVNGDDPVTDIPPKAFGYQHHGTAIQIADADGGRDARFDHAIIYYAENVARG